MDTKKSRKVKRVQESRENWEEMGKEKHTFEDWQKQGLKKQQPKKKLRLSKNKYSIIVDQKSYWIIFVLVNILIYATLVFFWMFTQMKFTLIKLQTSSEDVEVHSTQLELKIWLSTGLQMGGIRDFLFI